MAAPGMPDMPVQVEVDETADTEWNDILRKHGVIPEKPPSPTKGIEEGILQARQIAHDNRLEGKDLDKLDELEDDEDEEFLEIYRQKRMAEMSAINSKAVHGSVYPISKPDYALAVTEASKTYTVVVHLSSPNTASQALSAIFRAAATKYADIKFCSIRAEMAIENYPERNTPTILVYKNEEIVKQIVGLAGWGGIKGASVKNVEVLLMEVGAIELTDLRLQRKGEGEDDEDNKAEGNKTIKTGMSGRGKGNDSDDDWE